MIAPVSGTPPVAAFAPFKAGQRVEMPTMLHLGRARVILCQRICGAFPVGCNRWEVTVKWANSGAIQEGINSLRLRAC